MATCIGVVLFCVTFDGKLDTLAIRLGIIEIFVIGLPLMIFVVIVLTKWIKPNFYWKGDCVYQLEFKGNIDEITITLHRMGLMLTKKNENLYFFSLGFLRGKNEILLIKDYGRYCVLICSARYYEVLIKCLELKEVQLPTKGLLKNLN